MNFVVVGGGKMGMSHLALCSAYLGQRNVALCEQKFTSRMIFRFLGFRVYRSLDELFMNHNNIDGVIIATPTSSHFSIANRFLTKRIPTFIEKPLTLDVSLDEKLLNYAGDTPCQIGFVMRYVQSFQALKKLISSRRLGNVRSYKAVMSGNVMNSAPPANSWQGIFQNGGGALNEYGPHIIDLCLFIFGKSNKITNSSFERLYCERADDKTSFSLLHKDYIGDIEINWSDPSMRKSVIFIEVYFENYILVCNNSSINVLDAATKEVVETIPVVPSDVEFYLRGEEFSLQLQSFLKLSGDKRLFPDNNLCADTIPTLIDGKNVDEIINLVAKEAGLYEL